MDLNLSLGAVFHAEFESGSKIGPKPAQNPILINFRKVIFFFHENPDFYRAAASAGGLFNIITTGPFGIDSANRRF